MGDSGPDRTVPIPFCRDDCFGFKQATMSPRGYQLRWRFGDWHRVLNSGCKIYELRHHSVECLERAIAIQLVIARRVMLMTPLGREALVLPPVLLFSDVGLRVVVDCAQSRRRSCPSSVQDTAREVAILGGYTNRKQDPPPGDQLMWLGYAKLTTMSFANAWRDDIG